VEITRYVGLFHTRRLENLRNGRLESLRYEAWRSKLDAPLRSPSFSGLDLSGASIKDGRQTQPILTDRIDIDPSVTLSAKKLTPSVLSCAPST
jgi:hypothetical protein